MRRKLLVYGLATLTALILLAITGYLILDKPLPKGTPGDKADALATTIETALNKTAWDSTRWVVWDFPGDHHYLWDKQTHWVRVQWGDHSAVLYTKDLTQSQVRSTKTLAEEEAQSLIDEAWRSFCNDSYWLIAPYKLFDPGVQRSWVREDELLVQYESGGVTPGDAYLWKLGNGGKPEAYRMWVSIIPIGGIRATWEDWTTTETGAIIAQQHNIAGVYTLHIENLQTGFTVEDIGLSDDPFAAFRSE